MSRTVIDLHVLQTVPPSNVNRDDTGSPKTAVFGGVRRARVSSQAWKRAARLAFSDLLDRENLGTRTKRIVEVVAERVTASRPDLAGRAPSLAEGVVRGTGIELEKATRTRSGAEPVEVQQSKYLVFLSHLQLDQLAAKAVEIADAPDPEAAMKAFKGKEGKDLLKRDHSVDLALFGRMVADDKDLSVDACAQVAHAISVHGIDNEFDYFTAVDDEKGDDEDAGAGMIGTVEFNSSTLYRYATVDVDRLRDNLGDDEATRRAVEAFIQAFVTSMPTGKQNTFANRTLPDVVVVTARDSQSVNLVGAFEDPVTAENGTPRATVAARRLARRAVEVSEVLGQRPVATWTLAVGDARTGLEDVWDADRAEDLRLSWTTLPALASSVGDVVAARAGAPR
ncbi:type I-E CRISPR-associated protein Cas7/Cse4/CasC [Cellulomonas hominis]|uniref:type I-E CRISPR-associated protein Cas7/Cse4/CasC n=1 Tax=Cellulomonas hominis TaxID=156981 RepID=UPI001C116C48|nr:type I-E CRISPR-associated protein Cas7/Cse4/CasC [Cellulomonas hominis]MBU5421858.1 type I-E CRISPR-associated protein Cas7/Cse4/CasC [Cellulomonas hominis]